MSLQVEAIQHVGGSDFGMQIVTFEMLQQEEKNRQVAAAILTGVAGAANSTARPARATEATRHRAVAPALSTARQPQ